ncbi:2-C-methyl-D-erythritol 4-phosphate cytidylyltransferase [candidate division KSB1 bacterium]|nr:2-C-methyl-D-erythritol 4-phosphate cytidylyltransferase [candidate division KSB1 bacterium]RQW07509.1 MAG: 2-C-methyl-D-erythritol 4-phosphate cytidylyltransferase [candidate division KSB1 bacterium]
MTATPLNANATSTVAALIVAAGSGSRMGGAIPKQFIELNGIPILRYTLEKFQTCTAVDQIYIILPKAFMVYADIFPKEWRIKKFVKAIIGGPERHDSVWAGLQGLAEEVDIVLIHDGVRPFLSHRIIRDSIAAAERCGAAVVGLTPTDTVKYIQRDRVEKTVDRRHVLLAQTPQTFARGVIMDAYRLAKQNESFSTDDAALVEQAGGAVAVVPGDWRNIKITSPEDLIVAQAILDAENRCE